jgi:hypothetical protein
LKNIDPEFQVHTSLARPHSTGVEVNKGALDKLGIGIDNTGGGFLGLRAGAGLGERRGWLGGKFSGKWVWSVSEDGEDGDVEDGVGEDGVGEDGVGESSKRRTERSGTEFKIETEVWLA